MPFFLKNCLKLRRKKNKKKPKVKDVIIKPVKDRTDQVTTGEIQVHCRPSVTTTNEQENEELDAKVCNGMGTNVSTGIKSAPAVESAQAIAPISATLIQKGDDITEMDKKSRDDAHHEKNVECDCIKSGGSVEIPNKEGHDDAKSKNEEDLKMESISETSERRDCVSSSCSKLGGDSSEVEKSSEIKVGIDSQHEKLSGNDSVLEGKDAGNNSMKLPVEPPAEASEETVCMGDNDRIIEKPESPRSVVRKMSKIVVSVNVRSNVFEKVEELRRLQNILDEYRQNQVEEVSQDTEQIKDAEISGVVNKKELTIHADCEDSKNCLNSAADEDIRNDFDCDNIGGFEGKEYNNASKLSACCNAFKSHVTDICETNGDCSFEEILGAETEPSECKITAEKTTDCQFITPENKAGVNISARNEENIPCSKVDKSSSRLDVLGKLRVAENMASNTTERSDDVGEASKYFSGQSCKGDVNYENPPEHEHNLSDLNSEMHKGEIFSKSNGEEESDYFGEDGKNDEKYISESRFEVAENKCEKLDTKTGIVDLIEKYGTSVDDYQTDKSVNKWGANKSIFNSEANMNVSDDHTNDVIKRKTLKNNIEGNCLVLASNKLNNKSKDSLSINFLDCIENDYESGDYTKNEEINVAGDESNLKDGNESCNKNTQTDATDMCNEFSTAIDQTVETDEIGDRNHLEKAESVGEWTDDSDSRNCLYANGSEDCGSLTQNCDEDGLKGLSGMKISDMNSNSNSRSDTTFDIQNKKNTKYFSFLEQFSSDTSSSFAIQTGSNIEQLSPKSLESSINNFSTNDNTYEDSSDTDFRNNFIEHNEKNRLLETSSPKHGAGDLKNIRFPMNFHRSARKLEKNDVSKEDLLNILFPAAEFNKNTTKRSEESLHEISSEASVVNQMQKERNDTEESECPILDMLNDNIDKDRLLDKNLNSKKNKKSTFHETCFDSDPMLHIKHKEENFSSNSLVFESSSPISMSETEEEICEEKPRRLNTDIPGNGSTWDEERTAQKSGPQNGLCLATVRKGETGSAREGPNYASQSNPVITINILPRSSCKSKKLSSTRREDGGSGSKNASKHHRMKQDPNISRKFIRGIPENVLDEIEVRRRESLYAFNKKKEEALSDMKPTARVIPIMQSRYSSTNSQLKRPPVLRTSPILLDRDIHRSSEVPILPFGCPAMSGMANGDRKEKAQLFGIAEKITTKNSNGSLNEFSSQASDLMTPDRKRVLDASREIRSRKYPVEIDGKTCVINARGHTNPHNLKTRESEIAAFLSRDKKSRLAEKQSGKHGPVKGEFKIHSPEKIEFRPFVSTECQNIKTKFDYAFKRYAGRGRLDSNSISFKRSREWLRDAGIVGKFLTDVEANDAFKCTAGVKTTMNKGDFRHFIKKLAVLKRLNDDELYEQLCSVVAKRSYAAREIKS